MVFNVKNKIILWVCNIQPLNGKLEPDFDTVDITCEASIEKYEHITGYNYHFGEKEGHVECVSFLVEKIYEREQMQQFSEQQPYGPSGRNA